MSTKIFRCWSIFFFFFLFSLSLPYPLIFWHWHHYPLILVIPVLISCTSFIDLINTLLCTPSILVGGQILNFVLHFLKYHSLYRFSNRFSKEDSKRVPHGAVRDSPFCSLSVQKVSYIEMPCPLATQQPPILWQQYCNLFVLVDCHSRYVHFCTAKNCRVHSICPWQYLSLWVRLQ